MSAAANIVTATVPQPCCEPLEVELVGSKDLRRMLAVHRSRYGGITIYVRPQRPTKTGLHRGWFEATAAVGLSSREAAEQVAIRYHKGRPSLWIGHNVWFDLLPAEADKLIAKFGFRVASRES